jgi:hypothetical protein
LNSFIAKLMYFIIKMNESEIAFLELITNYLKNVAQVAQIFKEEFNVEVEDLGRARFVKTIPFKGSIEHRGISHFSYHGIGLYTCFLNTDIDWDFYFEDEKSKIDGFDSWCLLVFARNYKTKYKDFLEQDIIEVALRNLAMKNIITKPQERYSHLWILNTMKVIQP